MFKGLIENLDPREKRKSFAIQRYPLGFWVDFWEDKKVQIRDSDIYDFAEDLKLCLGQEGGVISEALCAELDQDIFDLVVARRELERKEESRKSWIGFARSMIAGRERADRDGGEVGEAERWETFLKTYNIPLEEKMDEASEDHEVKG